MNKIEFIGRCRGDGKLYSLFKVQDKAEYTVSASFDGSVLPSRLVWLSELEFVVILPDFSCRQTFSIYCDSSKVYENRIIPSMFALSSKANGVLNKHLCNRIRNIDRSGLECLTSLALDSVIPSANGVIIRGHVLNCLDSCENYVVAFDGSGRVLGKSQWLSDCASSFGKLVFSLLLSDCPNGLCLALYNGLNIPTGAFICMKSSGFSDYLKRHSLDLVSAFDDFDYVNWLSDHRLSRIASEEQRKFIFPYSPLFSVIVPLYKTPLSFFRDMADSVLAQTYSNWELVLVNSTPEEVELKELVAEYAANDSRIKVIELDKNYGITGNTNEGIKASSGDYLCFFDHDDVLEPDILFEYASAVNGDPSTSLLYCDEDKLLPDGSFANPTFKPDFSIDMVRDNNYICHLLTVKRDLVSKIEPSGPELDGAQDHAMVLKIAELGLPIHHVPKILYHWRISPSSTAGNADSKPYASVAGIRAVQEHFDRVGIKATVSSSHDRAFRYSPKYLVPEDSLVSLIVPTRGDGILLKEYVEGLSVTSNIRFELIFVTSELTSDSFRSFLPDNCIDIRVVEPTCSFNYGSWCNLGASKARGDVFVFMHDDARPDNPDWLYTLAGFALRQDVGSVGTMTCDTDGVIQQAGLSFVGDSLVRLSRGIHESSIGYIFMPLTVRNVAAVSGVCIASSRRSFDAIGGFDEDYRLDYHDVDYCFRAASYDLKVVYTPEARLYHRSRIERRLESDKRSYRHFEDKARLLDKWARVFANGDPFFNDQFSRDPKRAALYKLPSSYDGIG